MVPFAVIGSEKTVVIDGQAVRGRKTRWATINVEDERHCEFVYLRNFLTRCVSLYSLRHCMNAVLSPINRRTHLQDLIETTSLTHYETFRAKQVCIFRLEHSLASPYANCSTVLQLTALKESSAKQQQQQANAI